MKYKTGSVWGKSAELTPTSPSIILLHCKGNVNTTVALILKVGMDATPHGKIIKADVSIAKNDLIEVEMNDLERIVPLYGSNTGVAFVSAALGGLECCRQRDNRVQ